MTAALWTCPDCGRQFANTNQWHRCTSMTIDQHLADKTGLAAELYERVVEALSECGEFRVHAQSTGVGFITRMTFGGVVLRKRWIDVRLILSRPIDNARVRSVALYGPHSWGHIVRITDVGDIDGELCAWLCEAHRRGSQEDFSEPVAAPTGYALERFSTSFVTQLSADESGLRCSVPEWVVDALADFGNVDVQVSAGPHFSSLVERAGFLHMPSVIAADAGAMEGQAIDVTVRPAL